MPAYRRQGGAVTRAHLRARVGGSVLGAGRRIKAPLVDPPPVPTGTMTYTQEPIGAGGWVTGNTISPDGLTRLGRTDTAGAFRWDTTADKWLSSVDGTSMPAPFNTLDSSQGTQAIIAANAVSFMAYNDAIFKSTDRGVTWQTSLNPGPKCAANTGNQRYTGLRMAIDPSSSNICIYGTVNAGLYYTPNGGTTWTQVPAATLPIGSNGAASPTSATWGINNVAIAPNGDWWAAPFGSGIWRSVDHGATWTKISSDANFIATRNMRAGGNGDIMATTHTTLNQSDSPQVWRYSGGTWANITPNTVKLWHNIAYDPNTAGRVMLITDGGQAAVSNDYGTTWGQPARVMESADDVAWLGASVGFGTFGITPGELNFDSITSGRIWLSQGLGVWYADLTTSITATVSWHSRSRGIEQMSTNDVLAPPGGPALLMSWDRAVFVVGESSSAPVVTVRATYPTPVTTAAGLNATLVSGYPNDFTYAWTVLSKPAGSTAGAFASTNTLSTSYTPDVVGDYVLRLTATNTAGSATTDVALTATTKITSLILPGSTGNYASTPDVSQLALPGSLTLEAKLSMVDWAPAARVPIIAKYGGASRSYALTIDSTGLAGFISTSPTTGTAAISSGVLSLAPGSVNWVRMVYNQPGATISFYRKDADAASWVLIKTVSIVALGTAAASTVPLTIGWASNWSTYLNGRIYQARVLDASGTVVAGFNAEAVTRTAARTPATLVGDAGLTWTPQGTGWDWS